MCVLVLLTKFSARCIQEFPYQFDGNKEEIVQKNLIRVAETWMDGMRKYFYASTRVYPFKRADITDTDELASLEERRRLRQRLQCRNFEWYMYNIIPEVPVPPMNAVMYGEIRNSRTAVRHFLVFTTPACVVYNSISRDVGLSTDPAVAVSTPGRVAVM